MNDPATDLLLWARGTGFILAVAVFVIGLLLRLIEIYTLGTYRHCIPPPNPAGVSSGTSTVFRRFLIPSGMLKRAPVTYLGGYVFHVGFFITLFLFVPHIELFKSLLGVAWPAMPNVVVDMAAVLTMIAMLVVLVSRLTDPVKRFLSRFEDYLVWLLTFLPLLTGYLALHHLLLPYTLMLALHFLSAELLLAALPFTKLIHFITALPSRWITGQWFGRKGVIS
jgi:nitrate reductase gamma subunit